MIREDRLTLTGFLGKPRASGDDPVNSSKKERMVV